jgi:hypothetical protein
MVVLDSLNTDLDMARHEADAASHKQTAAATPAEHAAS